MRCPLLPPKSEKTKRLVASDLDLAFEVPYQGANLQSLIPDLQKTPIIFNYLNKFIGEMSQNDLTK